MPNVRIYLTREIESAPYEEILYEFPSSFSLQGLPSSRRIDVAERVDMHGGIITSDKKIRPRDIIISGTLYATSPSLLETEFSNLVSAINEEDLKLTIYFEDVYFNVEMVDFKHSYYKGSALRYADVSVQFRIADSFRYAKILTTQLFSIVSLSQTVQLSNSGDVFANPVITLMGGVGSSITRVKIVNRDNGNKYFQYDGSINFGTEVVIDSNAGTVQRNGTNDINNFSGTFPVVTKNTDDFIIYTTGAIGLFLIQFDYRQRWL